MTDLEKSILSTIVFYDAFDFPLSSWEIFEYLTMPRRFREIQPPLGLKGVGFPIIINALDGENLKKFITEKNGFYFLKWRDNLYQERIERQKIADQKWKKALNIVKWFQIIPFARMVCASGSLSLNHTKENSDLDVFVVSAAGRIWTTRFLLAALTFLFGAKRFNNAKNIRDKICFNHFITAESLFMGFHNISTANAYYARLELILENGNFFKNFYKNNKWIKEYLPNFNGENKISQRTIKNFWLAILGKVGEWLLGGKIGDFFEQVLRRYQLYRIGSPISNWKSGFQVKRGGRIIVADTQLEFHPHSLEKRVTNKYNSMMKELGLAELAAEEYT